MISIHGKVCKMIKRVAFGFGIVERMKSGHTYFSISSLIFSFWIAILLFFVHNLMNYERMLLFSDYPNWLQLFPRFLCLSLFRPRPLFLSSFLPSLIFKLQIKVKISHPNFTFIFGSFSKFHLKQTLKFLRLFRDK